jgi:hypothetical protein
MVQAQNGWVADAAAAVSTLQRNRVAERKHHKLYLTDTWMLHMRFDASRGTYAQTPGVGSGTQDD